ncbi:hypothetical protein G6R40_06800 [Chryseobacterium sp. POL2]|uniref:hypothetical protein n=1 Tax=Chryseobacterium sp. POL2 TaxID=2713414 RepID=UPI0013E0FA35|nr:hypothetical protein [Chryseobacterium sp. POL2]QIG89405.1 hypothetical protein G6R40_06800 [Chryseobacterium sp. POL2]
MAKQNTKEFEFEIRIKDKEPLTIQDVDLRQSYWDYISEIERIKPQTVEDWGECDMLDDLMQNYFTWKLIHKENNLDITEEMGDIEDFITKYLKKFYLVMQMDELNRLPPAFQITD